MFAEVRVNSIQWDTMTASSEVAMPTISVKDEVRLRELIPTVQSGRGSRSDVEALLVKIRQLAHRGSVLQDICNFATHPEGRDSGASSKHLNTMYDRFRLLVIQQGFLGPAFNIRDRLPPFAYRAILDSCLQVNAKELRRLFALTRANLQTEVKAAFEFVQGSNTFVLHPWRLSPNAKHALQRAMQVLVVGPAYDIETFHTQLISCLGGINCGFSRKEYLRNKDQLTAGVLCLIAGTVFELENGAKASAGLNVEGDELCIQASLPVTHPNGNSLSMLFSLICTKLKAQKWCDATLFVRTEANEASEFNVAYRFADNVAGVSINSEGLLTDPTASRP